MENLHSLWAAGRVVSIGGLLNNGGRINEKKILFIYITIAQWKTQHNSIKETYAALKLSSQEEEV